MQNHNFAGERVQSQTSLNVCNSGFKISELMAYMAMILKCHGDFEGPAEVQPCIQKRDVTLCHKGNSKQCSLPFLYLHHLSQSAKKY